MKKIVDKHFTFTELVSSIQSVHNELLGQAKRAVNISLTLRNWLIFGQKKNKEVASAVICGVRLSNHGFRQ